MLICQLVQYIANNELRIYFRKQEIGEYWNPIHCVDSGAKGAKSQGF